MVCIACCISVSQSVVQLSLTLWPLEQCVWRIFDGTLSQSSAYFVTFLVLHCAPILIEPIYYTYSRIATQLCAPVPLKL